MKWRGKVYIDMALPFGLCSVPKIFNSLADALELCLCKNVVRLLFHYLDNFLTIGDTETEECLSNMDNMLALCSTLGLIVAPENVEGPLSILTFVGIELDTIRLQSRLLKEKLEELKQVIREWQAKRSCTKRELHLECCITLVHLSNQVGPLHAEWESAIHVGKRRMGVCCMLVESSCCG